MPRGRPKKIKPELVLKEAPLEKKEPQELEEYVREANEVHQLINMTGWHIIKRDLAGYKEAVVSKLAYMNPKRMEFNELRLLYLAAEKLIIMVEDYQVNREKAMELLDKLENPDLAVALDIDNE